MIEQKQKVRSLVLAAVQVAVVALTMGLVAFLVQLPLQAQPAQRPDNGSAPNAPLVPADVQIAVDEIVASGFDHPVQVTHAGDGSNRLFVVEQPGTIRVIKNGTTLSTPFLDISSLVLFSGERGLLGLAFHPQYKSNGYFYVNYTQTGDGTTIIARYSVSASNPDVADLGSASILLTVAQPYSNHNGGQVLFGPNDGYLYIGMGDGGSGGDPDNNGQNADTLLGAMLRLDVDSGTPYAIPPDNPYVGVPGQDEIWAIGLRNPWRFSFDRQNGDLYIGDVGQNLWEEISYQAAGTPGGLNFGWRCKEGTHDYDFSGDCLTAQLTDPIAEYDHTVGRSVSGGFVYRGSGYPALVGRYFYADYVMGKIWSLYKTGSNPDTWSAPELELESGLNISAFGEDEAGELYVVDWSGGTVRRLVDATADPDLALSRKRASSLSVDPGEVVSYTIELVNSGGLKDRAVSLVDNIPAGLTYIPGSLQASHGTWDDGQAPTLTWQGNLNASRTISITYQVTATGQVTGSIVNQAILSGDAIPQTTLTTSVSVPRSVLTTTQEDFFFPGTQPEGLIHEIAPSLDCDTCHTAPIYDRWRGSMMSQAGRDPLLWAALAVANVDAPNAGDYCLRCHTTRGWLEGRSHPSDGSALLANDISNGVACALCHRLVDPIPSTSDEATAIDQAIRAALTDPVPADYVGSAALIVDPNDRRRGPFSFDPALPYHSAYQTDFLGQTSQAITRARLCGSCHNVDNPVLSWDEARGQYWPNDSDARAPVLTGQQLFPIERTFDEWLLSDFAQGGVVDARFAGDKPDGVVSACQDCHLPRSIGAAADPGFDPATRDCTTSGCLPTHVMVGGNTWIPQLLQDPDWRLSAENESEYLQETLTQTRHMLHKAATLSLTLTTSGGSKLATVRVTNHAGHKLPTGYPEGRQMWINLQAFDANGLLLYESGAYDPVSGLLIRDPDAKVYECKQGITPELANLLNKSAGASFHFVLNNTTIKDNRIPPKGYSQALWDRPGLRPVGATYADDQHWDDTVYSLPLETEKVIAKLYYQTASGEYVDFLRAYGGADGLVLSQLWQSSKSPPQLMAQAFIPSHEVYLPTTARRR